MGQLGGISLKLILTLALAWLLIFFCLMKGVKSSGKVGWRGRGEENDGGASGSGSDDEDGGGGGGVVVVIIVMTVAVVAVINGGEDYGDLHVCHH